ncbi:hypothetical protein VTN96DRAFT_10272 [Rasamsonia emersonii]
MIEKSVIGKDHFQIRESKDSIFTIGTSSEDEGLTLSWDQMMDSVFGILFLVQHGHIVSVVSEILKQRYSSEWQNWKPMTGSGGLRPMSLAQRGIEFYGRLRKGEYGRAYEDAVLQTAKGGRSIWLIDGDHADSLWEDWVQEGKIEPSAVPEHKDVTL